MAVIYEWFLECGFRDRVKMWHYLVTNSNTFLSSENEVRPSVGPFFCHSILPSVCLSVCPSVRPTCERDILRTVSRIDFKFEIWYQITRITDAIDFGPSAKNKMAANELFKYMLQIPLVNAISLESLHRLTSNLISDVILHEGRTLFILGHLLKTRWPPSNFLSICYRYPLWTRYLYNRLPIDLKSDFWCHTT